MAKSKSEIEQDDFHKRVNQAMAAKPKTETVYLKDEVLEMQGKKVISRRPRKKGEGKDNSVEVFKNKEK